jgi:hypothetical protein
MSLILVLSLQAAVGATPAAPVPPPSDGPPIAAVDFDLARYRPPEGAGCLGGGGEAGVLVCGRRGRGDYPMDYWDRIFGPERRIRAELGLGGGATGNVHVEQHEFSDRGLVANRVMVGIKLPF